MMNGIDISHWQKDIDLSKVTCDFVIAKATEGINYTDPCFEGFMRQAESLGKSIGFYHFAHPEKNTAKAEALYFYSHVEKYIGKGIPVLDWESSGKANVTWAKQWLDQIYALTGVRPLIYMSEAVANAYNWSSVANANYGVWIAKYRDNKKDYNYNMSSAGNKPSIKHWQVIAMWQWTSVGWLDGYKGNLDLDVFYGSQSAWNKYAGVSTDRQTNAKTEKTYTVQRGDTLSGIAKKFNTTVDAIAKKNSITNVNKIYVGQTIKV